MLGNGGKLYWVKSESGKKVHGGVVVVFGWVSIHERHLKNYVDLYASLGWDSLVCYADFLNAIHPQKATALAFLVLNEVIEELRVRPCPIVFAAFSGASKACMYKVFQIIEGTCEGHLNPDDNQLLKSCLSGHIYDSCPVDFTSDFGARFALHPSILKMPGSFIVSWIAKGVTSGLDALFLTKFESQHTEYWQTLLSSVGLGAPYLILCSENDDLAPYRVICNFVHRLRYLGGDVKLVKWSGSPHVGHYMNYPIQYKAAVSALFEQATSVYYQKIQQLEGERSGMEAELICNLQKVAVKSNQSLRRVAVGPCDHFFLPSSAEYQNGGDSSSQDEGKENLVHTPNPPSISAHSVLGQILFDVCVPKNIEGWDIKFNGSVNGQPFASARRHSPLQGIKSIRRSKL